jgi:thioredoxin
MNVHIFECQFTVMKKGIIILGVALVSLASLGMVILNKTNTPAASNTVADKKEIKEEKQNVSNMEKLTKEAFLEKVFNYEQNKEWKYEGELPCLIDFYADWCGPCKMVHPILEELSKEYDGKIKIYQIDTEAEQELAAAFGIRSIPSLLFCPTEGQPQMAQGALPKATLKKAIHEILLETEKSTAE